MLILYRVSIWLYGMIIRGVSPFHLKANKFYEGRRSQFDRIEADFADRTGRLIWMHLASVGEFEQGRPVLESLKERDPDLRILLTFFSPSGYEACRHFELADHIHYLPMDTPDNARRFVAITKPNLVVFIKYEFWYYYLRTLHQMQIPVVVVSALFRKNQMYFHPLGRFFLKVFKPVRMFYLQDNVSASILEQAGLTNHEVVGDTRLDRVLKVLNEKKKFPIMDAFTASKPVMVLGSIHEEDLEMLSDFVIRWSDRMKFIVAPHELSPELLARLDQLPGSMRYTIAKLSTISEAAIVILDTIGMLSAVYGYGDYAYVGGGFRGGLHNLLEPAAFGLPLFWGTHSANAKFIEPAELIKEGGGFSFESLQEFEVKFERLWNDAAAYRRASDACANHVQTHRGATEKITNKLLELI